jgi:hypothetical protein
LSLQRGVIATENKNQNVLTSGLPNKERVPMFSYWAYILVGANDTGKTHFQRSVIRHLCDVRYDRLPINVVNEVNHPRAPKAFKTLFTMNRSYQEKISLYKSVKRFFGRNKFFKDADACILSSHLSEDDISEMITHLKRRCYNVAGVFWSNSYSRRAGDIALLPWDERLWIENPPRRTDQVDAQLDRLADHFSQFLIARAQTQ